MRRGVNKAFAETSWTPVLDGVYEAHQTPLFSERHFSDDHVINLDFSWKDISPWTNDDFLLFAPFDQWMRWIKEKADISGRGLLHLEFILPLFFKRLPSIMAMIEQKLMTCAKNDKGDILIVLD